MKRSIVSLFALGIGAALASAALAQGMFMNPFEERAEGVRRYPAEIAKGGGLYPGAALQGLVRRLGMQAAQLTAKHPDQFVFSLVNDPSFNAYTTPGGFIYVQRGIMPYMNDEAELSGLLAHEVGHAIYRHNSKEYARRQVGGRVATMLSRMRGGGDDAALKAGLDAKLNFYSQDNEFQSDDVGVKVASMSGLDPYGTTRMLLALQLRSKAMEAMTGRYDASQPYERSHPYHADRIRRSLGVAQAATATMASTAANRDGFLALLDGFPIGPGAETGGRVLHVRVVTVRPTDTATTLAARMAFPRAKLAWFMALNGFVAAEDVKPGMKVKLAV